MAATTTDGATCTFTEEVKQSALRRAAAKPPRMGKYKVRRVEDLDGFKFFLDAPIGRQRSRGLGAGARLRHRAAAARLLRSRSAGDGERNSGCRRRLCPRARHQRVIRSGECTSQTAWLVGFTVRGYCSRMVNLPTISSSISMCLMRAEPMAMRPMARAPTASAPRANAPAAMAPIGSGAQGRASDRLALLHRVLVFRFASKHRFLLAILSFFVGCPMIMDADLLSSESE